MQTTFLILHGLGGKSPENWQAYLAKELSEKGANVIHPDLPSPMMPSKGEWLDELEEQLKEIDLNSLVVAGHSLGCALWLHFISKHSEANPKYVFLVAPPLHSKRHDLIQSFYPLPPQKLSRQNNLIIGSNDDDHIEEEDFVILADQLGIDYHKIPNAGHLNTASGFGKWDWMEQECLSYL